MAPAETDDTLTCPFCGRVYETQDDLTTHFTADHGMSGF